MINPSDHLDFQCSRALSGRASQVALEGPAMELEEGHGCNSRVGVGPSQDPGWPWAPAGSVYAQPVPEMLADSESDSLIHLKPANLNVLSSRHRDRHCDWHSGWHTA